MATGFKNTTFSTSVNPDNLPPLTIDAEMISLIKRVVDDRKFTSHGLTQYISEIQDGVAFAHGVSEDEMMKVKSFVVYVHPLQRGQLHKAVYGYS